MLARGLSCWSRRKGLRLPMPTCTPQACWLGVSAHRPATCAPATQLHCPPHPCIPPPAGGALSVDSGKNAACYGEGVSSKAILSGSVAPPPQLEPLYSRLSELASS